MCHLSISYSTGNLTDKTLILIIVKMLQVIGLSIHWSTFFVLLLNCRILYPINTSYANSCRNTDMWTLIQTHIMKCAVWTVYRTNMQHLHNQANGQVEMPDLFILAGWNWVMFGNHWSLTASVGAFNVTAVLPPSSWHSCHYWQENIHSAFACQLNWSL